VPQWQSDLASGLRSFFRSGDVSDLVDGFKAFEKSRGTKGFIQAVLDHKNIKEAPKEFPEIEYEVKFDITPVPGKGTEPSIAKYLDAFDFPASQRARFLKDPVNAIAEGKNHFFGQGLEERLVVIEKGGKTFLKEKGQPLELKTGVEYEHVVIKRTEERHEADMEEINRKIAEHLRAGADYLGVLRKEKGDAFLLDTHSGRMYSFTVTRAHSGERIQRQLEIEYAGYIPGFPEFTKNSEPEIVQGMVDAAKHVYMLHNNAGVGNGWKMQLAVTAERKYDFIRGADQKALPKQILLLPSILVREAAKTRR
jgi:hypothetical protein